MTHPGDQRWVLPIRLTGVHILLLFVIASTLLLSSFQPAQAQTMRPTAARTVLVLYDSTGQYGHYGWLYAQQLVNLIGHFPVTLTAKPVEQYTPGMLEGYDATFYFGVLYGTVLPEAFLDDVQATTKTVCWLGQNLWQLAWTWDAYGNLAYNTAFEAKTGFGYDGISYGQYTTVTFRGATLDKDPIDGYVHAVEVLNATKAKAFATVNPSYGNPLPYMVQAGNFWFVADNPFGYVGFTDRYLAFAETLHYVLGYRHATNRRAMVRIEDVSPIIDPAELRAIADALSARNVPFMVSVIPIFADPKGEYTGKLNTWWAMSKRPAFLEALRYMESKGGKLLCHGYTHQYAGAPNPFNYVTGDDAEFFRLVQAADGSLYYAGPVPEDSATWAYQRVNAAKNQFRLAGLTAVGWNTPHYVASAVDYGQFRRAFAAAFCRGLYFSTGADGSSYFLQQMAPYVIRRDVQNFRRIPETMGYIDPYGLPPYYPATMPQDMLQRARANKVVRDGWASFYFHPYLDLQYLTDTVDSLKAEGFTFVTADQTTL